MKTGENVDLAVDWLRSNTSKLAVKRKVNPLMFLLAELDGFPILEIDKIGIKDDPSLLAGFLAAIESFSQRLFGKSDMLQYIVSGEYKYIIKTDEKYIYSMIIAKEECQEEARRQIDLVAEVIDGMEEFGILESVTIQALGIDPSEYVLERGFKE
jgi:hypothetical protein